MNLAYSQSGKEEPGKVHFGESASGNPLVLQVDAALHLDKQR